jgi:hypothetical protein
MELVNSHTDHWKLLIPKPLKQNENHIRANLIR